MAPGGEHRPARGPGMKISGSERTARLSQQELDLIERFRSSYHAIEKHLRTLLRKSQEGNASLTSLAAEYARISKGWSAEAEYLKRVGDLRNVLIHETIKPYQYLAVPTLTAVQRLEAILARLTNPVRVIPTFQKKVEAVSVDDSLADVLKRISKLDYSQFPFYDKQIFKGLLTENGITRWLAHHVSNEFSLVDLADVPVRKALKEEERRPNCLFISRDKPVDEITALFAEHELLEAALITENGNRREGLLGIITRWDIIQR